MQIYLYHRTDMELKNLDFAKMTQFVLISIMTKSPMILKSTNFFQSGVF